MNNEPEMKNATVKLNPVMVTTSYRGVFFGYADPVQAGEKVVRMERAQMCVSWSVAMKGVMGLAAIVSPARVGRTESVKGPLKLCGAGALHGTTVPSKWKGDRWWLVHLHEPVVGDADKLGSLARDYVVDLGKCPF